MNNSKAIFSLLVQRLSKRLEFKVAVTVSLLFAVVAFIETCMHFYGSDVGDLPSPAYAWAWNMDAMQVNSMRVYLHFFMPILAAMAFSGSVGDDIKRGVAGCLASRSSVRTYLVANIVLTYAAGFLLVFGMLLLLQLLAFVAFPIDGVYGGYLDTPIYVEVIPDGGLMYDLRMSSPYAYNMVFAVWSAAWAGACSLVSFGLMFVVGRHKALPLVLPTLVSLALFQFAPMVVDSALGYLHFPYCYPDIAGQAGNFTYFAGLLLAVTALSLAISFIPFAKGKDVFL